MISIEELEELARKIKPTNTDTYYEQGKADGIDALVRIAKIRDDGSTLKARRVFKPNTWHCPVTGGECEHYSKGNCDSCPNG